jgi:hypothetical protein
LPSWLKLSTAGVLTGTPLSIAGSPLVFTITATDSNAGTISRVYSLKIDPALTVNPATLAVATVGDKFTSQLKASGGSGKGYVFTATDLPSWLTLSSTGLLSGTPTTISGSPLSFTITLTDSNNATTNKSYEIVVDPALTVGPGTLPAAMVGDKFTTQLTASGGSGKGYVFTATGLPTWLKLTSTGLLSGTPRSTTGSPMSFTIIVTDSNKATGSEVYSLEIDPA